MFKWKSIAFVLSVLTIKLRRTAGYIWTDYKTNAQIVKELKITPILDKLLEYKRNWIQHVNRMLHNRLPREMKRYSPTGRRNHGRPLKRLLDTWDRNGSTSGPTPWQIYDDDELLLENQFSNCFITLSSLAYTASIFLSIISILISAKTTNFATWIFKGKTFIYNKNKKDPKTDPSGAPCFISLHEDLNIFWFLLALSVKYFNKLRPIRKIKFYPCLYSTCYSIVL